MSLTLDSLKDDLDLDTGIFRGQTMIVGLVARRLASPNTWVRSGSLWPFTVLSVSGEKVVVQPEYQTETCTVTLRWLRRMLTNDLILATPLPAGLFKSAHPDTDILLGIPVSGLRSGFQSEVFHISSFT